jgi:hypothetical protein
MKRTLLISVAAVALAAGSTVALSQGSGGGAGGAGGATMANPGPSGGAGASGGAGMTAPSAQESAPGTQGAPGAKGAQDRTAPQTQKSTQGPQGGQAPAARQSQDDKSGQAPSTRQSQGEQQPAQQRQQQGQAPSAGGSKQGAAERPMTSSNVSLTTEQKTTIRTTVLTSSAPRVTNVNFDIKIGTVVPRTVRVAPLPVTLIEIQPAWRGYMYFVYNDEIIVVEPGTLRIMAVLEV